MQLFFSKVWGGGELAALDQFTGFVSKPELGINYSLAVLNESPLARRLNSEGFNHNINFYCKRSTSWSTIFQICRLVKEQGINVIAADTGRDYLPGYLISRLTNCELVVTRRLNTAPSRPSRMVMNRSNAIVAISNAVKKTLAAGGIKPQLIQTIYHGIDFQNYPVTHNEKRKFRLSNQNLLSQYELNQNDLIVVISARLPLPEGKGHQFLLESLNLNNPVTTTIKSKNVVFLIVGDGPYLSTYKKLITESSWKNNFRFCGFQNNVKPFLNLADISLLPTTEPEALGMTLIESQAAGCVCIASDTGGIPEAVSNGITGFLIPQGDNHTLLDSILTLVENPQLLCQMSNSAIQFVRHKFSLERNINQLARLYQKISEKSFDHFPE